jgi:hypothetical protein
MDNRNLLNNVIDEDLYIQQQQSFQDLIINGHNRDSFIVEDFECSWGKSTIALDTLLLYKQKNTDKRILYVTERKEQCTEYAEKVNNLFGKEVAKAIISGDVSEREKYLKQYDIIFITHERYRRIGRLKNQSERNIFTDNRHLLIIDEKIEMCKDIKFSLTKSTMLRNEIEQLVIKELNVQTKAEEIKSQAISIYDKIVNRLEKYIRNKTKAQVIHKGLLCTFDTDIKEIDSLIEELKQYIGSKVTDERTFYIDFEDKNYQTILERIDDLREFYTGQAVVCYEDNEVVLYVPNYSMDYWKLENNLILDATASIDKSYSYNNKLFNIAYEKRIFKHINWTIKWANINTTTSGTDKYVDFEKTINDIILEILGEYKTLVFASKYDDVRPKYKGSDEYVKVNKYKGTVTHKGLTNSSNEFKELCNFINTTMNYADEKSYVLKYLYYSRQHVESWASKRKGNHREFINGNIESFKIEDMANGLYQAIKRVNRNLDLISTIVFLCYREEVRNIVISMFDDLKEVEHSTDIERMFELKNPTKIQLFEELCEELLKGEIPLDILEILEIEEYSEYEDSVFTGKIPKCVFAKCLNMSDTSFRNNVLNDKKGIVKKFFKENNILNPKNSKTINFKGFE